MKELKTLEKVFKILGDQVKLRILKILEEDELCVCEIMEILNISQSTASKKLQELNDIGFVSNRKDSYWTVYSINKIEFNRYNLVLSELLQSWLNDDKTVQKDKQKIKQVKNTSKRTFSVKNLNLEGAHV